MLGQPKCVDAAALFPFRAAMLEIMLNAGGGLVALLGALGEELHDDGGQWLWDRTAIDRRRRLARDVAMDPLHGVICGEWEHAGEHLVQGDAQRVEIAAGIYRAVHPPGLFG